MIFSSGQIVTTRGICNQIKENPEFERFVQLSLTRHFMGDWGNVPDEDRVANQFALEDGERLLSAYISEEIRTKIWIITEADRSITTVLYPSEY